MSFRRVFQVALFAALSICQSALAQEITVAAAADLQFAMQDVSARFQKETGKTIKLIYGSSGNFFQQIQNGAPFDMFFSANLDYPKKLEAAGLTEAGSYYQYARGKIVIWVPKESKLDLNSGLQALLDPSIKKIAIANPQHAPYGQAAVAAMQGGTRLRQSEEQVRAGGEHFTDSVVRSLGIGRCGDRRAVSRSVSKHERQGTLRRGSSRGLPAHRAGLRHPEFVQEQGSREAISVVPQDGCRQRPAEKIWFRRGSCAFAMNPAGVRG